MEEKIDCVIPSEVTLVQVNGFLGKWVLNQLLKKAIKSKLGQSAEVEFGDVQLKIDQEKARLNVKEVDIQLSNDDLKALFG